ncbi:hypothetical protein SpCBS45565_g07787 [Spizellomyces sp. 'palustris']|nr:hypothetical protein SpCBS45565_g07787 [Spizellomyces sp. 'palustris']
MPAPLIITSAGIAAGAAAYAAYHTRRNSASAVPPSPSAFLASSPSSQFAPGSLPSPSVTAPPCFPPVPSSTSSHTATFAKSAPATGGFLLSYGKLRRLDEEDVVEPSSAQEPWLGHRRSPTPDAPPGGPPNPKGSQGKLNRKRAASSPNTSLTTEPETAQAEFWKERFF